MRRGLVKRALSNIGLDVPLAAVVALGSPAHEAPRTLQERELLDVIAVRAAVVAQDVAVRPELLDNLRRGVAHEVVGPWGSIQMKRTMDWSR